jgi:hypothetical protein
MNYCCHDNYTLTGSHDPLDVNILNAYVQYLQSTGNVPPSDIPTFLTFYEGKVGSGAVADLGNKTIGVLPQMDCANFIETGTIDPLDVNILNAYVQYMQSTGNQKPNDVATFLTFYEGKVGSGAVAGLGSKEIKHLPTLADDTHVITSNGLVEKCDPTPTPTPTPIPEICTALVSISGSVASITIDLDTITDPVGITNGKLSALEIVFDNLEFAPSATTNISDIQLGDPGITTYWDVNHSEISGFMDSTGVMVDHAIRDNGSLPTQKHTTFTLLSLTTSLTLSDFAGQKFLFDVPFVTLSGSEPIISEIRAYDSSTAINKFNTISCIDDPITPHCCVGMDNHTSIVNGMVEDHESGFSGIGDQSLNGTICFQDYTTPQNTTTFTLRIGDENGKAITVGINALVDDTNNNIRYMDNSGECYAGQLINIGTEGNILVKV